MSDKTSRRAFAADAAELKRKVRAYIELYGHCPSVYGEGNFADKGGDTVFFDMAPGRIAVGMSEDYSEIFGIGRVWVKAWVDGEFLKVRPLQGAGRFYIY